MNPIYFITTVILILASQLYADDKKDIKQSATNLYKAFSQADWESVYEGYSKRLQFHNTWEAFFEANFAIEADQQWKNEAAILLTKYFDKNEAEETVERALKKNPKLSHFERIELFMKSISDKKALFVEWKRIINKGMKMPPPHDCSNAKIEVLNGGFIRLSDASIDIFMKREGGKWKLTSFDIEPELRQMDLETIKVKPAKPQQIKSVKP